MFPTRTHAPVVLSLRSLGGPANLALGQWSQRALIAPVWPQIQAFRATHGLAPLPAPRAYLAQESDTWPVVQGFSRHIVPEQSEAAPVRTVGYCWPATDPSWRPDPALAHFLANGPAPIVVTFGSTPVGDPAPVRHAVVSAARRNGMRLVIQSGWLALGRDEMSNDTIDVGYVPHEWLLPRAAAVVHHAGAGTAAAGLRAGVPCVPVPALFDQRFWADRLVAVGVAPQAVPFHQLSADRLTNALGAALENPSHRVAAARLAEQLAAEDGVTGAVTVIERVALGAGNITMAQEGYPPQQH